jgi:hypothetical protein
MKSSKWLLCIGALSSIPCLAADRSIAVPVKAALSWGYVTPNSTVAKPSRTLGVGFWQRASGAKAGVGEIFVSAVEYQLPEAAPSRLRSATFRMTGKPSQCVGNEPVVIDVYAYRGDGKTEIGDATAGSKIAQMSADCNDHAAFSRPVDVTHIVRQHLVASGVSFVGFNVRKANNRQGPGLFALTPGALTVVIADQDIAARPAGHAAPVVAAATPATPAAMAAPVTTTRATPTTAPVAKPAPAAAPPAHKTTANSAAHTAVQK